MLTGLGCGKTREITLNDHRLDEIRALGISVLWGHPEIIHRVYNGSPLTKGGGTAHGANRIATVRNCRVQIKEMARVATMRALVNC